MQMPVQAGGRKGGQGAARVFALSREWLKGRAGNCLILEACIEVEAGVLREAFAGAARRGCVQGWCGCANFVVAGRRRVCSTPSMAGLAGMKKKGGCPVDSM